MAVPYALGEGTEQDRCVVDSLREAIRLKDSLYSKASVETLAKYNAEFGNTRLTEENTKAHSAEPSNDSLESLQAIIWLETRKTVPKCDEMAHFG